MNPKILVVRGGAIGDFILTLPVLSALRANFPRVGLEVLGYPNIACLASAAGLADRVEAIEARSLAGFFARGGDLDPKLVQYFSGFEIIISYLYDPDFIFQTNLALSSRAQFIAGPHRPPADPKAHATDAFLKPLERLAIFGADPIPRLPPKIEAAGAVPRETFCLAAHPGSGSEHKNWPEPLWADLLAHLAEATPWKLLLVGGEAEGTRLARLAAVWPADRVEILQGLALPELATRLRGCDFYLGHDSGITHLAAAVSLPGIVLWGASDREIWQPRGPAMELLHSPDGLPCLEVATVLKATLRLAGRPGPKLP